MMPNLNLNLGSLHKAELDQIQSQLKAVRSAYARLQRDCLSLLAVIHRDGGQYTDEHGREKSLEDALAKVAELNAKA